MQLRDALRVLRLGWPLLVLLLLAGGAVGGGASFLQRPSYVATAKAYVFVSTATTVGDLANSTAYTQQVAASFADIAGTAYVLRPVIRSLDLSDSPSELASRVTVTAATGESVLKITATDPSPAGAARVANAIADRLTTTVGSLTPSTNRSTAIKVTVVDPAVSPSASAGLGAPVFVGVGALAGFILALAILVLREVLDTRVRTAEDVTESSDAPLLGVIPLDPRLRRHAIALGDGVQGPLAESFRSLRTALQFLHVDDGLRSVVVTSSVASEGKSVTAVNLAVALAEAGEQVVLIDADLRRPAVSGLLGLEGSIGITDVLIGQVALDDALQAGDRDGLTVLPAGTVPPNPNELLQSRSLGTLLAELENRFDRVVIDAPPVLPVSDATILAHRSSGALVVAAAGRVRRAQLESTLAAFQQTRAAILGIVLTMVPARESTVVASGGYYRHAGDPVRSSHPRPAAASPAAEDPRPKATDADPVVDETEDIGANTDAGEQRAADEPDEQGDER